MGVMASITRIQLIDDIDGKSTAEETVQFGLDGANYEIDLKPANSSKLREALQVFVDHARHVKLTAGTRTHRAPAKRGTARNDVSAVREWARANGHTVSDRGRISADVLAAYDAAN